MQCVFCLTRNLALIQSIYFNFESTKSNRYVKSNKNIFKKFIETNSCVTWLLFKIIKIVFNYVQQNNKIDKYSLFPDCMF